MFNRQLQIGIVKTPKKDNNAEPTMEAAPDVDLQGLIRTTVEAVGEQIILGVGVYLALDTVRKILIKNF